MSDQKLKKLVMAALFAALTTVMTMVIRIPSPMSGYVNLGDCAVLLSAWILGPGLGCAAAGIGSMLADLLGYPLYAPGTLVVKGLMALAAGLLVRRLRRGESSHVALAAGLLFRQLRRGESSHALPALLASGAAGEVVMVAGYFLYEAAPIPVGLGLGALANVPFNLVQGVFGLVSAGAVYLALFRARALARL